MPEETEIGVDERALDDETLVALAEAHATAPPGRLRARVLAEARRDGDAERRSRTLRRWRTAAAIAAVLALTFAALTVRSSRVAALRAAQVAALARTNDELSARLDEQGRTIAGLRDAVAAQVQVLQVLAGPRTLTATLAPKDGAGAGRVVIDSTTGEGAIVLSGLEPLAPGRTYELWAIRGTRPPEPSGLFAVEGGRPLAARVQPLARPGEVTAFAVSIEPAAGSQSPTGPIILAGPIAS